LRLLLELISGRTQS